MTVELSKSLVGIESYIKLANFTGKSKKKRSNFDFYLSLLINQILRFKFIKRSSSRIIQNEIYIIYDLEAHYTNKI